MKVIIIIFLLTGFGCFYTIADMTREGILTVSHFLLLTLSGMVAVVLVAAFLSTYLKRTEGDDEIQSESFDYR